MLLRERVLDGWNNKAFSANVSDETRFFEHKGKVQTAKTNKSSGTYAPEDSANYILAYLLCTLFEEVSKRVPRRILR